MSYNDAQMLNDLPWARQFARSCTARLPGHLDHENLQSAGVLGYLRAAERFDISRGTSFRSFCAVRIRGAVLDELRRWDWAPRSVHKSQRRITRVTGELAEQLDREPTSLEVATALGITPDELASWQTQTEIRQFVSLDEVNETRQGEENLPLTERLSDPAVRAPDAGLRSAEDWRLLHGCLVTLPKTLATVLALHYIDRIPLREVADVLTVTPSRVSQLHQQALGRLPQAWARAQVLT